MTRVSACTTGNYHRPETIISWAQQEAGKVEIVTGPEVGETKRCLPRSACEWLNSQKT